MKNAAKKVEMSSKNFFTGSAKKPGKDVKPAPEDKRGSTSGAPKVQHAARASRLKNVRI